MKGMKNHQNYRSRAALILAVALAGSLQLSTRAQEAAPTAKPVPQWGEAQGDIQAGLSLTGDAVMGDPLPLTCALKNMGAPRPLPGAFAWLLVAQGKDKAYFSAKIPLAVPAKLDGAQTLELPLKLAGQKVFAYRKDLAVVQGYPTAAAGDEVPSALGTLENLVPAGKVRLKCMVYLPAADGPLLLTSNKLDVLVGDPPLAKLSPEMRQALVQDLVAKFRANEYASLAAHGRAVKLGAGITPDLIAALADQQQPEFARMWLATALCDIGDARAAAPLVALLDDPSGGVRYVVAFHGPKMKNATLDAAIDAKAQASKDPMFAAWAARGFGTAGRAVPDAMVATTLAGSDARAKMELAKLLAANPGDQTTTTLLRLVEDADASVRHAAVQSLADGHVRSAAAVGALIAALDKPGDGARQSVCAALCQMAGQTWTYDPTAEAAEKNRVVNQWKDWWKQAAKDFH